MPGLLRSLDAAQGSRLGQLCRRLARRAVHSADWFWGRNPASPASACSRQCVSLTGRDRVTGGGIYNAPLTTGAFVSAYDPPFVRYSRVSSPRLILVGRGFPNHLRVGFTKSRPGVACPCAGRRGFSVDRLTHNPESYSDTRPRQMTRSSHTRRVGEVAARSANSTNQSACVWFPTTRAAVAAARRV